MAEDADWTALAYGLTREQYVDAVKIASIKGNITRQSRAMAMCLKYDPDTWSSVLAAAVDLLRERARLQG